MTARYPSASQRRLTLALPALAVVLALVSGTEHRASAPPEPFDLTRFTQGGPRSAGRWVIAADHRSVLETENGSPTLFVADRGAQGTRIEGRVRARPDADDDFLGLALGVPPDALGTATSQWILIDWKQNSQYVTAPWGSVTAERGLAISRVVGRASDFEMWGHHDGDTANSPLGEGVTELARGCTRGGAAWEQDHWYEVRVEYDATRLRLFIDGALEFDLHGDFPSGAMAFYDFSQPKAEFADFTWQPLPEVSLAWDGDAAGTTGRPVTLAAVLALPGADASSPEPLAGRFVDFELAGRTCRALTDEAGRASCSVTPEVDGGPHVATARAVLSAPLGAPETSASVTLAARPTTLTLVSASVQAAGSAELAAVLRADGALPLEGAEVRFEVAGLAATDTTDATGRASVLLAIPDGEHVTTARFAGTSRDAASTTTGRVATLTPQLRLEPANDAIPAADALIVVARLLDSGSPRGGKAVLLAVTSGPDVGATPTCPPAGCTTRTDGTVTFTVPASARRGIDVLRATLDVNGNGAAEPDEPAATASILRTGRRATTLELAGASAGDLHDEARLAARLLDGTTTPPSPVADAVVTLTVGALTCTAVTDGDGLAACDVTPSGLPRREASRARFAGDHRFLASSIEGSFDVTREETLLSFVSDDLLPECSPRLTVALREDGALPLPGREVTLRIGGATFEALTDDDGLVSVTPVLPPGRHEAVVAFSGDATHEPATLIRSLVIYTDSGFTVWGGNNADPSLAVQTGETRTFWGASWPEQVTAGPFDPATRFPGHAGVVMLDPLTQAELSFASRLPKDGRAPRSCGGPRPPEAAREPFSARCPAAPMSAISAVSRALPAVLPDALTALVLSSVASDDRGTSAHGDILGRVVLEVLDPESYSAHVACPVRGVVLGPVVGPPGPGDFPSAPQFVSVERGNGAVSVSWQAPARAGLRPLTGYVVESLPSGRRLAVPATQRQRVVTALPNGAPAQFRVLAVSELGPGEPSSWSADVTPSDVPGAPVDVVVAASPGAIHATWNAPLSGGSAPVTGWAVFVFPHERRLDLPASAASVDVTGLTNGVPVTVRVRARNALGLGEESAPSDEALPLSLPGAPLQVAASAGDGFATVHWLPPTDEGGRSVTAYDVTSSDGSVQAVPGDVVHARFDRLARGVPVTFTVTATAAAGTGEGSAPSAPVTPAGPPAPPTDVLVSRGNASVLVSWTMPTLTGGFPLTGHVIESLDGSVRSAAAAGANAHLVTDLENGTPRAFRVSAVNGVAESDPSAASVVALPAREAAAPTILATADGNGTVAVTWSDVTDDGGTAPTSWTVEAHAACSPDSPAVAAVTAPASARTATLSNLTNGVPVVVTVTPVNAVGRGETSAPSLAVTPATTPDRVPAVVTSATSDRALNVHWGRPANDGGAPVQGFIATLEPGGTRIVTSANVTDTVFTGLLACSPKYTVSVVAFNRRGESLPRASSPRAVATVPGPPLAVAATAGDRQATVTWQAPASNGCSAIKNYRLIASPGAATVTVPSSARSAALNGLVNGTTYTFQVQASNGMGWGALSAPTNPVTPRSLVHLTDFTLTNEWVRGGQTTTATVRFDLPVPSGGTLVTFSSSDPAVASLPPSVTVPAGRVSYPVTVTTTAVTAVTAVDLTATNDGDRVTRTLLVRPAPIGLPPEVVFTAPADTARLFGPTEFRGTVTSDQPESWSLSCRLEDGGAWQEVGSGTGSGIDVTLGTLDTTLLLNGQHECRLTAQDAAGRIASGFTHVVLDGQQKIGPFTLSFADLTVPAQGIPIQLTRTYDSRDTRPGDFGIGWRLSIADVRLERNRPIGDRWNDVDYTGPSWQDWPHHCMEQTAPHVVTATLPNGKVYRFQPRFEVQAGGGDACWEPEISAGWLSFIPESGTRGSLKAVKSNGSPTNRTQVWALPTAGEVLLTLDPADALPFDPAEYELTTEDGMVLRLTRSDTVPGQVVGGHLKWVQDRAGNRLDITANGITATPSGVTVPFIRDARGFITSIVDPNGRTMVYTQDPAGHLVTFMDRFQQAKPDPADRRPVTFVYGNPALPHHLTRVIDQLGQRPIKSIFDDDGRLVRLCDGFGTDLDPDAEGRCIDLSDRDLAGRRQVVLDRRGFASTLFYDERGNVQSRIDADGHVWSMTYNDDGDVLTETTPAPLNVVTRYAYEDGRVTSVTNDALGETSHFAWSLQGDLLTMDLPGGPQHRWSYTYTADGSLETERDPLGHGATYTIGPGGRVDAVRDALLNETRYTYRRGLLETELDPSGVLTTYDHDPNGNVTLVRRSKAGVALDGSGTRTVYDDLDRPVQTWLPDDTPDDWSDNPTTRQVYDDAGRLVESIDELNRSTVTTFDALGQVQRVDHPDGTFEEFEHDASGNRIRSRDAAGRLVNASYDRQDRAEYTWWADVPGPAAPGSPPPAPHERVGYDEAGRMAFRFDALGRRWDFVHDAADRQVQVIEPLVAGEPRRYSSTTEYHPNGWVSAVIDQRGIRTEFIHDDAGRKTADVFVDGTERTYVHDDLDRVVTQRDELNHGTTFGHDSVGRLVSVTDARNAVTRYEHDDRGNVIAQVDALTRRTTYEHDVLGRRTARVLPLLQRESFAYSVTGALETHVTFDDRLVTHVLDPATDRVTRTEYERDPAVSYGYTPDGARASVTIAGEQPTVTTYDPVRGWPLTVTHPDGTRVRYEHDDAGNRTAIATRAPGGSVEHEVRYRFDALDRLSEVEEPGGRITTYRYRPDGVLSSVTYPEGTSGTYVHDDRQRLRSVRWTAAHGAELYRQEFMLDDAGRREVATEWMNGALVRTSTYVHDETDRLTEEHVVAPGLPVRVTAFVYDDVGNRLHETVTEDGVTVRDIASTYDANDRLLTAGDRTWNWYPDGTLESVQGPTGATTFGWDDQERMVAAQNEAGNLIEYGYDADGLRVSRTQGGSVRRYLYDGSFAHAQILEERDAAGALAARYTVGHRRLGQDRGGVRSDYLHDALGSTRALASEAGEVTDTWTYEAFGAISSRTGSTDADFLYAGEQWDPEAGMQYLRARWMNPGSGRFASRDPFEGVMTDPRSRQGYGYAASSPLMMADPGGRFSGLSEMTASSAIGSIVAAIATGIYSGGVAHAESTGEWGIDWEVAATTAAATFATDILLGGPMGRALAWVGRGVSRGAKSLLGRVWTLIRYSKAARRGLAATQLSVADKLARYLLNPSHARGGPKAKWFKEALGFTLDNAGELGKQIVFDAKRAVMTEVVPQGVKFNQVISITGANGRRIDVLFGWIRNNDGVVRLATAIPTKLLRP